MAAYINILTRNTEMKSKWNRNETEAEENN
jgi:hypothetical protein